MSKASDRRSTSDGEDDPRPALSQIAALRRERDFLLDELRRAHIERDHALAALSFERILSRRLARALEARRAGQQR